MSTFYMTIVLICAVSCIVMIIHLHNNTVISKQSIMWWSITYIGLILLMLAEFFGYYLDIHPNKPYIHTIVTLVEFSITPLLPCALSLAVGIRKPVKYIGGVALLQAILELIFIGFGGIFYISEDGLYHRGQFYLIYFISYVITYVYLFVIFAIISKKFRNRDVVTLIGVIAIILSGLIPSLIDGKNIKSAFVGIAVAAIVIYVYYEDLCQQDLAIEVKEKNDKISSMQTKTIIGMANLIESRDGSTGDHVKNTAKYVELLAKAALERKIYSDIIDEKFVELITKSAPMHDVGKIVVSDQILNKPGRFTPEEFEIMKLHAKEGERIVHQILEGVTDDDYTKMAVEVASCHHEKWNGTGYPNGLKEGEIPLSARIMAIADVYDALIAKRVYKDPLPKDKALEIILNDAGSHFDPILAPLFVEIMKEDITIKRC